MFRLGTTSYILPAEILPNVEYLAPRVDDVQLVLFETDEHGSNLPDAALCQRLQALAREHDLTYTVHLPLDLRLGDGGEATHISLVKARRVMDATRALDPFAYTLHLDAACLLADTSGALAPPAPETIAAWQGCSIRALDSVAGYIATPERLCVENIEKWDPDLLTPVLAAVPVYCTVVVGHLLLQGRDPCAYLQRVLPRTRVVHLHGIARRDHASVAHIPGPCLNSVLRLLLREFAGVLTLEVFNAADLDSSMVAVRQVLAGRMGKSKWAS